MARFLAIDADAHGLIVAAGTTRLHTATVTTVAAATDDPQPLSPATAKAVGLRLKEVLKTAGIPAAPVLLCVGRDKVVLRDVKHPPVPPADEPALVRFQALKDLNDAAEDVILDYEPLPGTEPTGEKRAAVASLRREMLAAARVMCETAGLKLAAVTPRPFALAAAGTRAIAAGAAPPAEADAPTAVLLLTEAGGEFVVVRGGHVRFARIIPAAVASDERQLTTELRRNLAVYAGQAGGDIIQAVYLAEAEAAGTGWAGRLGLALEVPVYPFDPLAGSAEAVPAKLRGRFAGPIGLLTAKAAGPLPINFVEPRQPKAEASAGRNKAMLAVLLALLVIGGGALGGLWLVDDSEKRLAVLERRRQTVENDLKFLEPEAKRLAAADEFEAYSVVWLDELYDISDRFPDIAQNKMLDFRADALPQPTLAERKKGLDKPRKPTDPPKPVAKLKLTVATSNGELPDKLLTNLDNRFQLAPKTQSAGTVGSGSRGQQQQFTIEMGIAHRKPSDYNRRLRATMPVPPPADPDAPKPADAGGTAP